MVATTGGYPKGQQGRNGDQGAGADNGVDRSRRDAGEEDGNCFEDAYALPFVILWRSVGAPTTSIGNIH
jgi:hypothetical protein